MKKVKRKLNLKRFLFAFIIPVCLISFIAYVFVCKPDIFSNSIETITNNIASSSGNSNNYDIIKIDVNSNYSGVGQEAIYNKDGYTKTFTTTDGKKFIEYKQNGTASWANNPYWSDTMATDGCGITAMSIILSGYGKTITPEDLRQVYSPVLKADNISSELSNSYGIKNTNFFYDSVHLSSEYIKEQLSSNVPVLICVWNKPTENRWTTQSHYMVLLAVDSEGLVYVCNPNGLDNTSKASGWYDLEQEIVPYLAKALYITEN